MILKNKGNILLISGTGRNVGKTQLACSIINELSKKFDVIGIKISNHFHPVEKGQRIIALHKGYKIVEERLVTNKDSSKMKQAGAGKVFYIQAENEYLPQALDAIKPELENKPVICESGGLHYFIKPGVLLLVKVGEIPENKAGILKFNPVIVTSEDVKANLFTQKIQFINNQFYLKN